MRHIKLLKAGMAAFVLVSTLAARPAPSEEVNMWDGQWHVNATIYGWLPFMYTTVQLPPAAGGSNPTIETQPSQYLKYLQMAVLTQASIQKGDWGLWTDFFYMNLQASPSHIKQIGLPGGDPLLAVNIDFRADMRMAALTLAPIYTVIHNDVGTLDVLAGLRYSSARLAFSYQITAPPTTLNRGGGFWPTADSTAGIVGLKGTVRLSNDGKWFMPYEADVGAGNENWQWNAFLGAGYHFHWGDVSLVMRNLTYQRSGDVPLEKVRMTGPLIGATFRW